MRIALLADFPVHALPGFGDRKPGHHATWLPPLAHALEAHGRDLDFHWITCTNEVRTHLTLRAWNQNFHLLPRWKLSLEMLTAFRRERHLIRDLLGSLKPDIVHGWGTEQGYALAASDFSGPSLVSMQGILQAYCKAAAMPWLTRLQARHEARALHQARNLTVESPWGETRLRQLAPQAAIHLLEYGANPACFEIQRGISPISLPPPDGECVPSGARESNRAKSAPPSVSSSSLQHSTFDVRCSTFDAPPPPLALFVGSLTRLKGVDTLLDAFTDPRLRHVDLLVLGTGDPALTRRPLTPNIRLPGHLAPDEVRAWMAKAWCLVHPTRADTSPNCVKEARVIGLPVVTTTEGGQTQYVEHGKSGFIHQPGDVEGLIQGVLTVTRDWETSLAMGTHGQAECRAKLHPTRTATRLLELYQRTAAPR